MNFYVSVARWHQRRRYLESRIRVSRISRIATESPVLSTPPPPPPVSRRRSRVLTWENHKINSCPIFVPCIFGLYLSGWAGKLPLAIYPLAACAFYSPTGGSDAFISITWERDKSFIFEDKKGNVSCTKEEKSEKGGEHCDLSHDCEVLRVPLKKCKRSSGVTWSEFRSAISWGIFGGKLSLAVSHIASPIL